MTDIVRKHVAQAALHPRQGEILEAVAAREGLSPVELSGGSATLPRVGYHLRALHRIGLLEPAGTAARRELPSISTALSKAARG